MYSEAVLDPGRVLWRSTGSRGAVIPADGCVDLILRDDDVLVAGPSTRWIATTADAPGGTLGLRFAPGAAALLGLDLAGISDRLPALRDLVGAAEAGRVREVLLRTRATSGDVRGLLAELGEPSAPDLAWAVTVRDAAARGTPPHRLAQRLGWSPRTLRRHMLGRFGYPYPTLVRLERARRAQTLLERGATPAAAAAAAGYADQPHLSRELRRLVGLSPGQLAASTANRSIELPSGSSTVA